VDTLKMTRFEKIQKSEIHRKTGKIKGYLILRNKIGGFKYLQTSKQL